MSNLWKDRRVTITGGAGFIGTSLARQLIPMGAQVRLVDNLERGRLEYVQALPGRPEFMQADLKDQAACQQALAGTEVLFHLAAKVSGIKVYVNQPGSVLTANMLVDANVLTSIVAHRIPRVFYASTTHVYPEDLQQTPDARPLMESDAFPARPGLSYGWGKLVSEISLLGLAREHTWLRVAIARICGAYGYNQDIALETGSVIPVFCHRAVRWPELRPFRIWGTGEETRSYCFIDDVVEGLLRCVAGLERQPVVGPLNLGAEGRHTIREIADTVARVAGKAIDFEYDRSMKTSIWGQAITNRMAQAELEGWQPTISLEEGIRRVYAHVQERLSRTTSA